MGFFDKLSEGIKKTRDSIMGNVNRVLNSFTKIDEDFFEELEETLIMSDIGALTSAEICDELRKKVKADGIKNPDEIRNALKEIIVSMLGEDERLDISSKPAVILVIGVNGAGKTTTIGKLAAKYTDDGKKVIIAAADTFRAAATEQLEIWAKRANAEIVKHGEGADPASVVFDALAAAKARGADIVICDTAGRLHNKKNLMDELKKITRICYQQAEGCSVETLLVLDATTGQNAVNQARLFSEAADITGIVLTKLDGTAKGGIIITIRKELNIPVKLIGIGEKADDLQEFHAKDFAEALFAEEKEFEGNYERITDEITTKEDFSKERTSAKKSQGTENNEDNKDDNDNKNNNPEKFSEAIDNIDKEKEDIISEDVNTENDDISDVMTVSEENTVFADEALNAKNIEEDIANKENNNDTVSENTDEISENDEEAPKKGKFDFLFKEITFGKKKKKDEKSNDND